MNSIPTIHKCFVVKKINEVVLFFLTKWYLIGQIQNDVVWMAIEILWYNTTSNEILFSFTISEKNCISYYWYFNWSEVFGWIFLNFENIRMIIEKM